MAKAIKTERSRKAVPAEGDESNALGAIVRTLRRRAGLTLVELSDKGDLAASTISKIESGQLSPGYETIQRLAVGLGVDVAELFQPRIDSVPTGRRGVTRRGQGVHHHSANYDYEALAPDLSRKQFLPLVATIKARSTKAFPTLPSHAGEEFVYVISGSVTIFSEHYEPLILEEGDSVYFDSRAGHALVSSGRNDAKVIWVCSDRDALQNQQKDSHE
ncbi:XRE family transcriptional regulator [Variovorax ureilyticus]|uniref:XRE family transcriptional regulator n=1 Tax=Variovorax ureilyticus TaxID=1836198 RepID=A0ABU8VMC2_9BURK